MFVLVKLIFKKLGALIKSVKSDITIHGRSLGGVCKGRYLYKFKCNTRKICSLLYSKKSEHQYVLSMVHATLCNSSQCQCYAVSRVSDLIPVTVYV